MGDFLVWVPDDGDRPDAPNVSAADEREAALIFVERNWADLDHCSQCDVRVDDAAGHQFCLLVEVEHQPTFRITDRE